VESFAHVFNPFAREIKHGSFDLMSTIYAYSRFLCTQYDRNLVVYRLTVAPSFIGSGGNKNTMRFIFQNAVIPLKKLQLKEINDAATRLFSKLQAIDVESLNISDYNKSYFGEHLKELRQALQVYSYILAWSIAEMNLPINKCSILDYGGGSGMISLLAKELDFKTVLYNDIYDISCHDAKTIGLSIGNQADHYILGDIDDVIIFLKKNDIRCNSIVSYDVIEHIYDMEYFIKKLPELTDKTCSSIVMSSGANTCNPLIVRTFKKLHYKVEFENREDTVGRKKRDALESYSTLRKKIVQQHAPDLNSNEIKEITRRTRGLIERDIINVVNDYKITKKFPPEPKHPTNTCDPYTGNWAEHLMDIYHLKNQLNDVGFRSKIIAGYEGNSDKKGKIRNCIIIPGFNTLINLPKFGICFAPFFTLYGTTCKENFPTVQQ
jgi:2-polyprenyl-3-methyl-5-hydroxy-6-metoxy-1,4-benzoquinol methylase